MMIYSVNQLTQTRTICFERVCACFIHFIFTKVLLYCQNKRQSICVLEQLHSSQFLYVPMITLVASNDPACSLSSKKTPKQQISDEIETSMHKLLLKLLALMYILPEQHALPIGLDRLLQITRA